jgi:hypothetical protein
VIDRLDVVNDLAYLSCMECSARGVVHQARTEQLETMWEAISSPDGLMWTLPPRLEILEPERC